MASAGSGVGKTGAGVAVEDRKAAREGAITQDDDGAADERISVSFNFRQRRGDIDPVTAPANEVVRADLLAR